MIFEKTIQNIKRIRDVIRIMGKYGFEDVVANTSLTKLIPKNKRLSWQRYDRPVLEYSRWERIRMCFVLFLLLKKRVLYLRKGIVLMDFP